MIVNGIIAEYNPFHNGHKYHIDTAKSQTKADYTVVIMSGNFTQRGEPALIDKFARAKMALLNGADLVLELPIFHATSSAEYFAKGGVNVLNQLNVVDHLCFGSECGNIEILEELARILIEEPEVYKANLKSGLQAGLSFPTARSRALISYRPDLVSQETVLTSPNNILGIEYIKAILRSGSRMQPLTTQRAGSDYHDRRFGESFCSALALRSAVWENRDLSMLRTEMPANAFEIMMDYLDKTRSLSPNDFSDMLLYKLLLEKDKGFTDYFDVTQDLSDRIVSRLNQYVDYKQFCELLKSKNVTYTRISRCLLHILLDLKKDGFYPDPSVAQIPYANVLGFRLDAQPLMAEIKRRSKLPLVTKYGGIKDRLSPEDYELFLQDLRRGSIYEGTAASRSKRPAVDERQVPMIVIE